MTMIVSYTWRDKIVMMADSRYSSKNKEGKVIEFHDTAIKIIPVRKRFVIGHSGLAKINLGNGNYFDTQRITEHFLNTNGDALLSCSGTELLEKLIETWNITFKNFGLNPFGIESRFEFILNEWDRKDEYVIPRVHIYQSYFGEPKWNGNKAVSGDDEAKLIFRPYFEENIDEMTFEETLEHHKKGYESVIEKVQSVGGHIHVYILDARPLKSHWHSHKLFI